jgi:hypothetical protein
MRNLSLLLLATFIISCNRIDKISEQEKNLLKLQIDSLKQVCENLTADNGVIQSVQTTGQDYGGEICDFYLVD